jgi:hypothetical protein
MKLKKLILLTLFFLPIFAFGKEAFTITIERNMSCFDESTVGRILINGKEIGRTLELPWRNNEAGISRIPKGEYKAFIRNDGKRKWRLQLKGVNDRTLIQIHIGNYQREIKGCILVGDDIVKHSKSECMVTNSGKTLDKLFEKMSEFAEDDIMSRKDVDILVVVK